MPLTGGATQKKAVVFEANGGKELRLSGETGIWIFVVGDLAVFTLFFILIMLGQREETAAFATSRAMLNVGAGVLNTLFLLTGSWFVAMGVERYRSGHLAKARRDLDFAILCGLAFIANKCSEWASKISAGLSPATDNFFMYFFIITGIHLFHVILGVGVLLYMRALTKHDSVSSLDVLKLESGGLFWHLVDLLWIVLFALFYLL
ncbi:MAG TPA: cytochrome c oxidase subunit 3 [Beijerinckia sp.]|jgi:nitric oxide reductase NorE protein|nr:cytochrome c oxidase subunit 3 [Beijerinckia sp.]